MHPLRRALVVFTRSPEAEAKAKGFRPDRGAPLFRALLSSWAAVADEAGVALIVSSPRLCRERIERSGVAPGARFQSQRGGAFGDRLCDAARQARAGGVASMVLIGSDTPAISAAELMEAFDAIERGRIVLGPSSDGGIYLVGMQGGDFGLLQSISPRNPRVCEDILAAVAVSGTAVRVLPIRDEIDGVRDARRLGRNARRASDWRPYRELLDRSVPHAGRFLAVPLAAPESPARLALPPRAPPFPLLLAA